MDRGKMLTTIAGTALAFSLLGGAPTLTNVLAQEATPPAAEAPAGSASRQKADFEAKRAEAYSDFVAALAAELGEDEAAVDAAIRAALIEQVNAREAAGEIDVERAAAIRAVIEVSDAPLFMGFGGPHGRHGFDGHRGGPRGGHGKFDGRGPRGHEGPRGADRSAPSADAPATLPGANDAADQAAPAPAVPGTDSVL